MVVESCYGLNVCISPNVNVEALFPVQWGAGLRKVPRS
jgi:hypothetical protein